MKKLALVLAVLTLGALASAQTLGFESYTGGVLYCNYEQISNFPTFGANAIGGTDNLSACGLSGNATFAGAVGKAKLVDFSNGTGKAVSTKGVVYGDNLYDAFSSYACGCPVFTGAQWFVASNRTPDTSSKKFGWYGLASFGGFDFGDNFGHLTSSIPHGNAASHGTSAGKFQGGNRFKK